MAEEKNISCSFCGRDKQDTQVLIAGINSHICDSCIQQATGIVEAEVEGKDRAEIASQMNLLKPIDIKNHLDQYVIGQDDAKKVSQKSPKKPAKKKKKKRRSQKWKKS